MWPFCGHSNKTCSQFSLPWQHVSLSVCFHDNKVFMFCAGDAGDQTLERSLTRSPVNFREGRRASDGLMSQGEYRVPGRDAGWVQGTREGRRVSTGYQRGTQGEHRVPERDTGYQGGMQGIWRAHVTGWVQGTREGCRVSTGYQRGMQGEHRLPERDAGWVQGTREGRRVSTGYQRGTQGEHRVPERDTGNQGGMQGVWWAHVTGWVHGTQGGMQGEYRVPERDAGWAQVTREGRRVSTGYQGGTQGVSRAHVTGWVVGATCRVVGWVKEGM